MRGRMSQLRTVAQKLHVQDDKCMKIGYNENNRVAQQIKVVQ